MQPEQKTRARRGDFGDRDSRKQTAEATSSTSQTRGQWEKYLSFLQNLAFKADFIALRGEMGRCRRPFLA